MTETAVAANTVPYVQTIQITGQRMMVGDTKTHTLYTLGGWKSSLLTITAIVHDVNSDTNRQFFQASYAWYRDHDQPPAKALLATAFNSNTGSGPAVYTIDTVANGNDIQVQVTQTGFDTVTYYTIVAQVYFAYVK